MIYLEMYGRLGNQFFRYAAARAVQLMLYPKERLVINFRQIEDINAMDSSYYNVLDDFNVADYSVYGKRGKVIFNETNIYQKMICGLYYSQLRKYAPEQMNTIVDFERRWLPHLNNTGVYWLRRGGWKIEKSSFKNKFLSGNFEDPQYFNAIKDVLMWELTPKQPVFPRNQQLYDLINTTNSVCLSVRRGDFESNPNINKLHSVCNQKYFEHAIERVKKEIKNPVFFMFSDEVEWVRRNIETGCETYYQNGTDPLWEVHRLMRACKHFIISNSTFCWWAQYLSVNKEKIVVSPCRWYNNDYKSPLISPTWILIEV